MKTKLIWAIRIIPMAATCQNNYDRDHSFCNRWCNSAGWSRRRLRNCISQIATTEAKLAYSINLFFLVVLGHFVRTMSTLSGRDPPTYLPNTYQFLRGVRGENWHHLTECASRPFARQLPNRKLELTRWSYFYNLGSWMNYSWIFTTFFSPKASHTERMVRVIFLRSVGFPLYRWWHNSGTKCI